MNGQHIISRRVIDRLVERKLRTAGAARVACIWASDAPRALCGYAAEPRATADRKR